MYYWYVSEVKFFVFIVDGVYFMFGGMEGVLVMWQLEIGKCNYLLWLGGFLVVILFFIYLFLYVFVCEDNLVKLLNIGIMEVERYI